MKKRISVLTIAMLLIAATSYARQVVEGGTIEMSGNTSFLFNKQSVESRDPGVENATLFDLTNITLGGELAFYVSRMLGVGAIVNYNMFKLETPIDETTSSALKISGGFFGGLVKVRLPMGEKSAFVLSGAGGATRMTIEDDPATIDPVTNTGFFWMAGGAVAIGLNDYSSLNIGVRYQDSSVKDAADAKLGAAGILASLGFSVYLR